jgi:hypothetical protein
MKLLHHAISTHERQWQKCAPFMLWAMRESGNETTGLSPYTLLYGHTPRGPLHILKESWSGSKPLPPRLKKSEIDYVTELRQRLQTVRDYAASHSEQAQADYVKAYNVRARDKSFEIGEKVIVLRNDSTNKLRSKWQTGIVEDIADEYSYLTEFTDGGRKRVHANELRPFHVRLNSVIVAADADFGDIVSVSSDCVTNLVTLLIVMVLLICQRSNRLNY